MSDPKNKPWPKNSKGETVCPICLHQHGPSGCLDPLCRCDRRGGVAARGAGWKEARRVNRLSDANRLVNLLEKLSDRYTNEDWYLEYKNNKPSRIRIMCAIYFDEKGMIRPPTEDEQV